MRPTFRNLLAAEPGPLVMPGAHDAISARLIARAGFKAYFIGGFPLVGARYGLPDVGLAALGEIAAGVRDIIAACDHLPVLVDGDNGYGDVKTAVHVLHTYERMGAGAIFFEDQVSPKRCGHMAGKQLMPPERMEATLHAISGERMRPDTFIIARTDARELHGLDEALRRGERYLRAGADGLFIEAPTSLEELARVGSAFAGVPQLANMLEGGRTPLLAPAELGQLGFSMVIYGISLLVHATRAMQGVLAELARGSLGFAGRGVGFEEYEDIVGFDRWSRIEAAYG
jgi:2-methylisocitrate lyase-like PEP mutase family enzyme